MVNKVTAFNNIQEKQLLHAHVHCCQSLGKWCILNILKMNSM